MTGQTWKTDLSGLDVAIPYRRYQSKSFFVLATLTQAKLLLVIHLQDLLFFLLQVMREYRQLSLQPLAQDVKCFLLHGYYSPDEILD